MNEEPRRTLGELIANPQYGRSLCDNPQRCEGLLRDFCGQYRKEIAALVGAVKEGIPKELLSSQHSVPKEVALARLTKRLQEDLALAEDAARWSVESWALALGVISSPTPLPKPAPTTPPAPVPTPTPTTTPVSRATPTPEPTPVPTPLSTPMPTSGFTPVPATPSSSPDWLKAVITGSVIGVFMLGGILLNNYLSTSPDSPNEPSTTSSIVPSTPSPSPTYTPPPPTPSPTISQEEARNLIERWLAAKREIFGTSYNRALGAELLTGRAYECNIRRPDGSESSVDWLQNNGAYYTYGVQQVDSVEYFSASGDRATIEVLITEDRTLYNRRGGIDPKASKFGQSRMRYDLRLDGGQWKIAYFPLPGCYR
jgi:hypothetical protein